MPQGGNQPSRISGQTIVSELLRNMELGRLELAYSVLLPCVFNVYLHPDDYARLESVADLIREDACRALNARMADWNAKSPRVGRSGPRKQYRIARSDWWIELIADAENAVPPGDVEIHSELNEAPEPGYHGAKTTLIGRDPSVTADLTVDRSTSRRTAKRALAEIRYQDESGPQTYVVAQDEISIGRGGADVWVDLPLYASGEISREHARLKRDPATGAFRIVDQSRNGTWLNGKRLARGVEERLPDRAEIGIGALKLQFEARR